MLQHLFHGSPPWVLAAAIVAVIVHVGAGGVGILSGAASLSFRKGGPRHRASGRVFVAAMLTMAAIGATLAMTLASRGRPLQLGNAVVGLFTLYLVSTAWVTVRRRELTSGRFEVAALFLALAIAAFALFGLAPMLASPAGRASGVPVAAPIVIGLVASLAAGLDVRAIMRGGLGGVQRLGRHVWRMCAGLFIATGSFFLGQQKVMPASMHGSPVLIVLGVAPLLAMIFWLVRIRRGARPTAAPRIQSA